MKLFVLCAIFMIVNVFKKCDTKCDQYFLVIKESSCFYENLRPQKIRDINWDDITYPCNSTDAALIPFKKECILEVTYVNTNLECNSHVEKINYQNHTTIPDEITIPHRYERIKSATTMPTTDIPKADYNETVNTNATSNEEDPSMFNVNIIYEKENSMNSSNYTTETNNKHDEVYCDYAETMCDDDGKPENYEINGLNETSGTLKLTIIRDEESPIQPIFTGYIFNDSNTHFAPPFKHFKSVNITCDVLNDYRCKTNEDKKPVKRVNIYLKTIYVQNNTVTKYFNCTNNLTGSSNVSLDLKCNNTDFANNNKLTLPTLQPNVTTTVKPDNEIEPNIPNSTVVNTINIAKYDLNLIYLNENDSSESDPTQQKVSCAYANICSDEDNPEIERAQSLQISINRDDTSPIQPIFTGYFDNHTKTQTDSLIRYFKTVTLDCMILLRSSCKQNMSEKTAIKDINIYLKSNYVQNNTITRYPNCTKNSMSSSSNNTLNVQCEDISFAEHNPQILSVPQLLNEKNEVKFENKTDIKMITKFCVAKQKENNDIHFENCSNNSHFSVGINETINKNHQKKNNSSAIDKVKNDTTHGVKNDTTDGVKNNTTNTFNTMNKDFSIKFLIPANDNNCTKNLGHSIHKGKIINSNISRIGNLAATKTFELQLSNCTESRYKNNMHPHPQKEILIFLQEYASNSSYSKLFTETLKDTKAKENVILQCNLPNQYNSTNTATDRVVLSCLYLDIYDNARETVVPRSKNCTTNKTLDFKTEATHNKANENNKKAIEKKEDKKEVRKYSPGNADYSKGTFNRRTDIANGAAKSKLSEEHTEIEKILLIGLSSLAGASMLVVLALRFRRKPKGNSEDSPPASTERPNAMEMDETAF